MPAQRLNVLFFERRVRTISSITMNAKIISFLEHNRQSAYDKLKFSKPTIFYIHAAV